MRRLAIVVLVLAAAPSAQAAAPLSPTAGEVLTESSPTFSARFEAGDRFTQIQVATSSETSTIGLTIGRVGFCLPQVPAAGGTRGCEVGELADGTYYWVVAFQRAQCQTVSGQSICIPKQYVSKPVRFVVRAKTAPPAAPQPPAPVPAPTPAPPPLVPAHPGLHGYDRPTTGGKFAYRTAEATPYASRSSVVHYVTTGLAAPPLNDDNGNGVPDYVEEVGAAADTAFAYYAASGFKSAPADTAGPSSSTDIYIDHFADPDLYGVTISPLVAEGGSFVVLASRLDRSPKLARGSLAGTTSHELFHVVQYGYSPHLPTWVAEGTASAMALFVQPSIEDRTMLDYVDRWLSQPWRPLFDERFYCDHCYGGAWWWAALAHDDKQLLPTYFEQLAAQEKPGFGLAGLDELLRRRHGRSLDTVFYRYGVGLYRAGLHPSPVYSVSAGSRRATSHTSAIEPLSMHFVPIRVSPKSRTLTLQIDAPKSLHTTVIVGGKHGRIATTRTIRLRTRAERSSITVLISSADTRTHYTIRARAR